jgi:ribonuclease P protein component
LPAALARPALGRLKKRSEFLAVAATNRRATAPGLMLQAKLAPANPDAPGTGLRLGFTATKKIGNAVRRNRARRRLRAAAAEVLAAVGANADLVLVARQDTIGRPFAELKRDLENTLRRVGIAP